MPTGLMNSETQIATSVPSGAAAPLIVTLPTKTWGSSLESLSGSGTGPGVGVGVGEGVGVGVGVAVGTGVGVAVGLGVGVGVGIGVAVGNGVGVGVGVGGLGVEVGGSGVAVGGAMVGGTVGVIEPSRSTSVTQAAMLRTRIRNPENNSGGIRFTWGSPEQHLYRLQGKTNLEYQPLLLCYSRLLLKLRRLRTRSAQEDLRAS